MGHSRDPIAVLWMCVGWRRKTQEGSGAQISCGTRGRKGREVTGGVPRAAVAVGVSSEHEERAHEC